MYYVLCPGIQVVNVANELPDVDKSYEKATEDEDSDIDRYFIFDEMWHFIEESTNKLWIIKSYDGNNNYLVNFELGGRDEETLLKLYNRTSNNYKKLGRVDKFMGVFQQEYLLHNLRPH